ncbi:MAG: MBL fold metallo-hydrolase [bacterium]|nr:MBL fold metallo-hydrolase [bacterium]
MNLYWYGQNSVGIDSGENSLVVSSLDLEKELKPASSAGKSARGADVVLVSQLQEVKVPSKTNSFLINNPGEYDVKGFFVMGLGGFGENIAYTIEVEGVRLCHLAGLDKELTDAQLENFSDIDILLIDIGSTDDSNETASKIVNQIEPRIVIPIGYDDSKKASVFFKEMGASDVEPQNKLNIKKKDLPQEETKTLLLNVV